MGRFVKGSGSLVDVSSDEVAFSTLLSESFCSGPAWVVSSAGLSLSVFRAVSRPLLRGRAIGLLRPVSTSSELTLLTAGLSLRPLSFRKLEAGLDWAARSTATKLARTLESGLVEPGVSEPAGDRPREGGEVVLFWLLVSNLASRLRTPD